MILNVDLSSYYLKKYLVRLLFLSYFAKAHLKLVISEQNLYEVKDSQDYISDM